MASNSNNGQSERSEAAMPVRRFALGLSGKLLVLTAVFVMLAEVLVFVPSVANFRKNWLMERLAAAQIAAIAVAPDRQTPRAVKEELLKNAQVHAVALKRDDARNLILQSDLKTGVAGHYDLRDAPWVDLVMDAMAVYFAPKGEFIRVVGQPGFGAGEFIEIVVEQDPLKAAMIRFGLGILGLSIIISIITAALVYLSLNLLLVRPMTRLTRSMVRFGEDPEDASRVISPSARLDEIGTAERELAHMQRELADTLQQKNRLAALGLAISKVNHDLRNMLSSAQLISDRLGGVKDPFVQRMAPKLIGSLDRAIRLCTETMKFGRIEEAEPVRAMCVMRPLVDEVIEGLGMCEEAGDIRCRIVMDERLEADIDRDQIYRVLTNLCRNAVQAFEAELEEAQAEIAILASRTGSVVTIDVIDNGPGVPEKARAHLFQAFQGSARKGGTGLGLAISAELVHAHGGDIDLVDDGPGTTFRVTLPDRVVELHSPRQSASA